jgi:hypothetical protein
MEIYDLQEFYSISLQLKMYLCIRWKLTTLFLKIQIRLLPFKQDGRLQVTLH